MTGDHVRAFIANPNSAGDASFDLQAERILIGDSVESRVRLFDVDGDLLQTIDDPVSVFDPDSRFGQVVALDGDRILVSDYNAGNVGDVLLGDGAVYQFGTDGQLVRTFTPPPRDPLEPDETQRFGFSLDIEGDLIVIGDPHRAVGVTDAGEVFVYSAATGELLRRFFSADPSDGYDRTGFERNSGFGVSVDLDGDYLAILASGAFQSTPEGEDDTVFASVYDLTFDEIAPRVIFQDQNLGFSHFTSFNSEAGLRTPVSPHSIAIEDGVVVFSDFNNVGQFNIFGNSAPIEAIVFTLPEAEINAVPLPQTIWLFAAALALFVRLKPGRPACA